MHLLVLSASFDASVVTIGSIDQLDALGRTSRYANALCLHTNQFALIGDYHNLTLVVDRQDGDNQTVPVAGLHIDHAFAAT